MLKLIRATRNYAVMKKIIGTLIASFLLLSCNHQQSDNSNSFSPEEVKKHLAESSKEGGISIYKAGKVSHGYSAFSACFEHIPNLITGEQFNDLLNKGAKLQGNIKPAQISYFQSLIAADSADITQKSGAVTCTYSPAHISKKSAKELEVVLNKNQSKFNQDLQNFLGKDCLGWEAKARNEQIELLNQELKKVDHDGLTPPGKQ